jgi:hypothetical protein
MIKLCNVHIITNARKDAGEWTFTGELIPVQIPYDITEQGGREIMPFLRSLRCLNRRESNVKCIKSDKDAYSYLIVNKSGLRPLLAITHAVEEIPLKMDIYGKRILPDTCTKHFPIDINVLKPGRKKYVNFMKLEKRKKEVTEYQATQEIGSLYEEMLDIFYQTLGKMTFPEIYKKTGIKEWRARSMLYDLREPSYREVASVLTYAKVDLKKLQEHQDKTMDQFV